MSFRDVYLIQNNLKQGQPRVKTLRVYHKKILYDLSCHSNTVCLIYSQMIVIGPHKNTKKYIKWVPDVSNSNIQSVTFIHICASAMAENCKRKFKIL